MPAHTTPAPTAGARVQITLDVIVQAATPGELLLTNGTRVTIAPGVQVTVIEQGFQPGDVAYDTREHRQLFRVTPVDDPSYWIATDGGRLVDADTDPTQLRLMARPGDTLTSQLAEQQL